MIQKKGWTKANIIHEIQVTKIKTASRKPFLTYLLALDFPSPETVA